MKMHPSLALIDPVDTSRSQIPVQNPHRMRAEQGFDHYLMTAFLQKWSANGKLQNFVMQTSIAHLPKNKLETIPLAVPAPVEEYAMMNMLNELARDAIETQQRLSKARQLKQAMMQQLLTGRIRLA